MLRMCALKFRIGLMSFMDFMASGLYHFWFSGFEVVILSCGSEYDCSAAGKPQCPIRIIKAALKPKISKIEVVQDTLL